MNPAGLIVRGAFAAGVLGYIIYKNIDKMTKPMEEEPKS